MKLLSLIASVCLMSTLAFANEGPCKKDREAYCKGIEKGGGAIHRCMKDSKEKLSVECKTHLEKMKSAMKQAHAECENDIENLCGDVEMGGGRIIQCLKANEGKLSAGCKDSFKKMKEHKKDHK